MPQSCAARALTVFHRLAIYRLAIYGLAICWPAICLAGEDWSFTDVTLPAGLDYEHGFVGGGIGNLFIGGGVAAGDFDGDGWTDLYAVRGDIGANLLFRNRGDGTFEEMGAAAGVDITGSKGSGPTFVDLDGDGRLDLVVGGMELTPIRVFRNLGAGVEGIVTFTDVTAQAGLPTFEYAFGAAFGDYDRDGDLDAFFSQWNNQPGELLWRNEGNFNFAAASAEAFDAVARDRLTFTFTPNFADMNSDGWPDLVVASDFNNSQVLLNRGDGGFDLVTDDDVIIDNNGMGASVADYDNDGVLDWFVTAIRAEGGDGIGNRLYRGLGDGSFVDTTEAAGVSEGYWGWGACFADFDNDGWTDIFHVNGFLHPPFEDDPSRLFVNQRGGADGIVTFSEQAQERGIVDRRQGRGLVCFDYDRDGDLDIFTANNSDPPRLFRNDGGNQLHYLQVTLAGQAPNTQGVGARIVLETSAVTRIHEMRAASNFVSQDPVMAHFGLGSEPAAARLEVHWLDGLTSVLAGVAIDRELEVDAGVIFADAFESGELGAWAAVTP
ncbi:MAG: CRTAC1 family protein [bacterium]|nr:CRTAC1 family protein [bacterium]